MWKTKEKYFPFYFIIHIYIPVLYVALFSLMQTYMKSESTYCLYIFHKHTRLLSYFPFMFENFTGIPSFFFYRIYRKRLTKWFCLQLKMVLERFYLIKWILKDDLMQKFVEHFLYVGEVSVDYGFALKNVCNFYTYFHSIKLAVVIDR